MTRNKVRIRFRKAGDLRFVSHHDLIRAFERMLRRADLPFHSTEGFHPKPKMAFASALGLGIVGCQEVLEIELDVQLPADEIHRRLAEQAPPGLDILSVRNIDLRTTGQARRARYRLPLDPAAHPDLGRRLGELLSQDHCRVERTKPQPRRVDIRPYLLHLAVGKAGLVMDFQITPQGTARPEEVLQLLGLGDLLAAGAVLERAELELEDENRNQESGIRNRGSGIRD
jgi:radical SAM-linked protein